MSFKLLVLIICFAGTSCNKDNIKPISDIELSDKSTSIIQSNNDFGIASFKKVLSAEEENQNILISPLSISQALSMTLNGARENTAEEMKNVLGFGSMNGEEINSSNKEIIDALIPHDPKVELNVANSIWYRKGYSVLNDFITTNENFYNAEVSALDFSAGEKAKKTINNWVDDKTNGKIDEIVEEINSDHIMFLINAIYFNASWKFKFEKSATSDRDFFLEDGTTIQVPTMFISTDLETSYQPNFQMVKIPYGSGKFYMLLLVPDSENSVSDITENLTATTLDNWLGTMHKSKTDLYLPRFEFEYKKKLNDPLIEMGMPEAFSNFANFSGINPANNLKISKVLHKSFIKTDEKGTEAAAVTSVEISLTSVGPNGGLHVDKPFIFFIMEEDTNSILFCGKVGNPLLN